VKLGFLTACMPERSLEEIAAWAGSNGFEALELAAWPGSATARSREPRQGRRLRRAEAERVRARSTSTGSTLSALAYYDNNLHPDPAERAAIPRAPARLHRRRAAKLGGVPVGTFIGRDPGRSVAENLREAERSSRRSSTTPASAA
jgi:sugar phosphate isomerase/epimerase